jgi:N-acetylglucosamine kinase-like BadF-type ATPase
MSFVLGVDAGGTKTVAVVAGQDGQVRGVGKSGSANFQACGVTGAQGQIRKAVEEAAGQAGVDPSGFAAVCYGVAGADRPKDFDTIRKFVEPLTPCQAFRLENDTIIALRAGTPDGEGIALIAGTGSNAIGRTRQGLKLQVGGLGRLSGDFGSGGQLAEAAVVAAMMGQDGRGPPTSLTARMAKHLGLKRIEDIVENTFYDSDLPRVDLGSLAPLVFEAAAEGDQVAQSILREAGKKIALGVNVILNKLFPGRQRATIVFGGAVFQKGKSPLLIESVAKECLAKRPQLRFVRLEVQPVLGAVAFAFDDAGWKMGKDEWKKLKESVREKPGADADAGTREQS